MVGILSQYLKWHYYEMSSNIWQGWRNFLEFGLNYFSILRLFETLFSPWHRYVYEYPRHFDPAQWFNTFTFNLMSRGIGVVVRIIFILIGVVAELFIGAIGLIIFSIWMLMPLVIVASFFIGLWLLI